MKIIRKNLVCKMLLLYESELFSTKYFKIVFLIIYLFNQLYSQVVINEILASNLSYAHDNHGEFDDIIELHNLSNDTINLEGYFISDDFADLTKWVFPSHDSLSLILPYGYITLWADSEPFQGENHLPFSLNKDGETLILVANDGFTIIDQKVFSEQYADISYGRDPSSNNGWSYFINPSIGRQNNTGYEGLLSMPFITPEGGVFLEPFNVSMFQNDESNIFYTANGYEPSINDIIYINPINISETTIINGRSFKDSYIPSYSRSHLYLSNSSYSLPILALLSNSNNFWNDSIGIYTNYLNEGVQWERRANIQFFSSDSIFFHNSAGVRIQGRSSRVRPKKSFRLFYKNAYDFDHLDYPIFGQNGLMSFKNLVLRSGYDDDIQMQYGTLIRDPLVSEIWRELGMLSSESRFSNLFINDQYWGIYNIRESVNEYFISDHTNYIEFDLIRYLKNSTDLKFGTLDEWYLLNEFIRDSDFSIEDKYEEAKARIDMENFLNLQALIICAEYRSWGWGVSAYREKSFAGKWKWTIWDMDRAFTNTGWNGFTFLNDTTGLEYPNSFAFQLLKNENFKFDYINRVADFLNTIFKPENIIAKIDSLENILEEDIVFELERWNRGIQTWRNNIGYLRSFALNRPDIIKQQLINYFSLGGCSEVVINSNLGGIVKINSVLIDDFPFNGTYFKDIPITIEAIPSPGYTFDGWVSNYDLQDTKVSFNLDSDSINITARFNPININNELEVITPSINMNDDFLPIVFKYFDEGKIRLNNEPIYGNIYVNDVILDSSIVIKKGVGTYLLNIENIERPVILNFEINDELSNDFIMPHSDESIIDTVSGIINNIETIWEENSMIYVNSDLLIDNNSQLVIHSGVQVILAENVNIIVYGSLSIQGAMDKPIIFKSNNWEEPWGGIEFYNSNSNITNCFFINAGSDPTKGWAHTNTQPVLFAKDNTTLDINNSYILFSPGKALGSHTSSVDVNNVIISFVFQGGEFHYTNLIFDNSYVMNIPNDDGIFVDEDNDGFHIDFRHPQIHTASIIKNSFFIDGKDDAIDHYRARVNVKNCWIENWMNEGIAASGSDTIKVTNTISKNCSKGFEVGHGSATIIIDHSLALGNTEGFRFGDNYSTPNTGKMIVTNSIAYDNIDNIRNYTNHLAGPLFEGIDISFSITNDSQYDHIFQNMNGHPIFNSKYRINYNSVGSSMGTGGKNIGLIDENVLNIGPIVINEIMYEPSSNFDSGDWIEIYNPGKDTVNLSSWIIKDENEDNAYIIPDSTFIAGENYLVISNDMNAFLSTYNYDISIIGNIPFGFGLNDQVRIYSSIMSQVDSLNYEDNEPWPLLYGNGQSIELINISNNSLPENWLASMNIGGTPGMSNYEYNLNTFNKNVEVPTKIELAQNYPNPFNPITVIPYFIPDDMNVKIIVYDVLGKKIKILLNSFQTAGYNKIRWDSRNDFDQIVPAGIYFYMIETEDYSKAKKMILIK